MNGQEQESQEQLQERSAQRSANSKDWLWRFWFTVPLYPYDRRQTLRTEVVKDMIWTFDQLHGILYTIVPIRMTVVKLAAGGLFVYAPVAPTPQCIDLVKELVAEYGEIKYIVLPTSSGLEHKVFVGPFARCFPQAQVFVAPNQWSYPVNLPLSWLGFPAKRTQILPEQSVEAPFANEFDYRVLDFNLGRGSFAEVAVFHGRSHTLLVTDAILSVPEEPPAIVQLDPYPLLFHARDSALEGMEDNAVNRRKGWQRTALFAIYFRPSVLERLGLGQTLRNACNAPNRSRKAYFGLFPFRWKDTWKQSFDALRGGGRPFVAPILQTLIFSQAPRQVLDWADQIARWDFQQIIPCHFDAPIPADPHQFRQAFACLKKELAVGQGLSNGNQTLPEQDFEFIRQLEANLIRYGIATPPKEKV
jgi:hypothetical protein